MRVRVRGLSTRGHQIVVPNSNHGSIPKEVVITAVRDVVGQVRSGAASNLGSLSQPPRYLQEQDLRDLRR